MSNWWDSDAPAMVPNAPAANDGWWKMDPTPQPTGAAMAPNVPSIAPGPRTATMPDQPVPLRPWGDVALDFARNLPSSLWKDVAVPTYDALRNRPLETGENVIKLMAGIPDLLPQPRGTDERNAEFARTSPRHAAAQEEAKAVAGSVVQDFKNAYGDLPSLQDTLANHPGRVLMDTSTLSPVIGATLPGKVGAAASTVGKIIDPVTSAGNALRLTTKYGMELPAAHQFGLTTGIGARSLRDIGSAGRELGSGLDMADGFIPKTGEVRANAAAVVDNMNKGAPVLDLVGRAKNALSQARQARSTAYKAGMKEVGEIDTPLSFQPIEDAVASADKVQNYKGVQLDPSATATKEQIADIVQAWKNLDPSHPIFKDATDALTPENYHTPVGLDALKQLVGDVRATTLQGSPARAAADRVYRAIGSEITKAAPDYAAVMAKYGSASGKLEETTRTFSLGERATGDTAARKLLSATNTGVGGTFGNRTRLLDDLAQYDSTLPYAVAGQAAQSVLPRGLVARGGLMAGGLTGGYGAVTGGLSALAANPLLAVPMALGAASFSPRIVGNTVYLGGRLIGTVDDVAKAMRITPAAVRAAERGGYQAGQNDQTANRGLELYRQRGAIQGNPYFGGP